MLHLLDRKQDYNGKVYTLKEYLEDIISELEFRYSINIHDLIKILELIKDKYKSETERIEINEGDY